MDGPGVLALLWRRTAPSRVLWRSREYALEQTFIDAGPKSVSRTCFGIEE
jgi:hypothetical protein